MLCILIKLSFSKTCNMYRIKSLYVFTLCGLLALFLVFVDVMQVVVCTFKG